MNIKEGLKKVEEAREDGVRMARRGARQGMGVGGKGGGMDDARQGRDRGDGGIGRMG